jgi:hypothetical protein
MELKNSSRLPVMVHMTCLTGLFTHPKNESLAEALLWQPEGGAAAVIAPTSLTLPLDQGFLSEALARAFLQDPSARLGDLLLQAQRNFPPDSPGAREVMLTYLLFGDPGQRLVGE